MSASIPIPTLLTTAWLLPLAGFAIEVFGGYWQRSRKSQAAAFLAVGCIAAGFVLSAWALALSRGAELPLVGEIYQLAKFGSLSISLDYYIDSLTLVMFAMVTLVATCIHVFALGYMADELTEDHVDHVVHVGDGHLHRRGRSSVFFSYMSLFCFSMLGLVLAGNIFMVFIFWELVGICSYLLIGFYVERHSASTAANKAFIVNRVGDFGFLIGMMILWTSFGTFRFAAPPEDRAASPGLFQMLRDHKGQLVILSAVETETLGKDGTLARRASEGGAGRGPSLARRASVSLARGEYRSGGADDRVVVLDEPGGSRRTIPYWLLVAAGLGIFAGCVGKSAQFPLQTWLPDAMEGPTPVSALVHSATMVAAGVYLAGRFFPMFTPEVLLVIAYVGAITLFLAATIAVVATDIKRVLAYSTISQLGYMMLAIGVGGWGAGLFHLITHAFFKSLMFLCAGSVIIACHHEQEMPRMGGLWRKLPITAFTMLVGVLAICGLAVPGVLIFGAEIAFSGYHSKDAIVATALAFNRLNSAHFLLFIVPLVTAGITAFYMFRLWFSTFLGQPRDGALYEHAHESPRVMTVPLVVLALFAAFVAVGGERGTLYGLIDRSAPAGLHEGLAATETAVGLPSHQAVEDVHDDAGTYALVVAILGTLLAYLLYGVRIIDPGELKRHFPTLHTFLVEKWRFDELYDAMFVRPTHVVAGWCARFDRGWIDELLHWLCRRGVDTSQLDRRFDEGIIDGAVNLTGNVIFAIGRNLRVVQTGLLRQYVMFIAVGVVTLFVLLMALVPK